MAKPTYLEIDEAKARAQIAAKAKKLTDHTERLLIDEQEPLKERIISLAPENTGHLRENVVVDVVMRPSGPVLKAGVKNTPYAVFNELGTSKMPPRPFVRPPLHEVPNRIKRKK